MRKVEISSNCTEIVQYCRLAFPISLFADQNANGRLLGMEQNNLHELWALLNVLYPEVLSSSSAFDDGFRIGALYQVGFRFFAAFHLMGSTPNGDGKSASYPFSISL